jgi:hypothetical protein
VCEWSDDYGNDENVMLLVDNGPLDINPDLGVFESMIYADSDQGGFLRNQGATFFMTAVGPDGTVSGYTAVSPVSGSTNRVTGTGTMPDSDTGELVGVSNMWLSIWDWYTGDMLGMGITGPDGTYDIGIVELTDYYGYYGPVIPIYISVDENYDMTNRYVGVFENGGWDGYGDTWIRATILKNSDITIGHIIVFVNAYIYGYYRTVVPIIIRQFNNTNIIGSIGSCNTHSKHITSVPVPYRKPHIRNAD